MALFNLGSTGGALPRLSLSPAEVVAEGSGTDTVVSYTLTLARNGATGAVPYSWSVAGSGAQPAQASDFAGGTFPAGSGTFAPGQTSRTIAVTLAGDAIAEADETFAITVSATLSLAVVTSDGTIANDDAAAPAALLMGSRFNQMGFGGYAGSDATDADSNSRIGSFNETGATVTRVRGYFANWLATSINERDGYNDIAVTAAIEYPAGSFTPLTFGGAATVTIPPSGASLAESDEAVLSTPVPAGAQYWVRTFVSVAAGGRWPQGYLIATAMGEAADFSTGAAKAAGGTITNAAASPTRRGYGPVAVKATGWTGTAVGKAFAAIGDSLIMGASDSHDAIASGHGNIGYFAKAAAGQYPVINLGIAGTTAADNLPAAFTRRTALLKKIGVTHVFGNWAVNDLSTGRNATQIAAHVSAVVAGIKDAMPGVKMVWATTTPRTSSSDAWKTVTGQSAYATPAGAFTGGAAAQRAQFNALLRGGVSGIDTVFDAADVAETARDSGIWRAGEGSTHLTSSGATSDSFAGDGLHPTAWNTTAPGLGGIYVLRDAVRAVFAGW